MPDELARIASVIHTIRGQRVILDADLARLYGVSTKVLNQALKRNQDRLPETFAFQLTQEEATILRSQFVTLQKTGHFRYFPHAFTEHGALMAANILQSKQAIQMSIAIVEAFVRLRRMTVSLDELHRKVDELEQGFLKHGRQFEAVFEAIRQLMTPPEPPRRKIGFHSTDESINRSTARTKRIKQKSAGPLKLKGASLSAAIFADRAEGE